MVHLEHHTAPDDALGRWLAVAEERVGPAPDDAAAGGRRQAAKSLYSLAYWLRLAFPCDHAFVETALCTAIIQGGDPDQSTRRAVMGLIEPRLDSYPPTARSFLHRFVFDDDPIHKRAALLALVRDGGLLDKARYLKIFGHHGAAFDDDDNRRGDVVSQAPVELFSTSGTHIT